MTLSRQEKEKRVLELYYDKGYTYRQIARELRMSPNQIREIIKRHEEKNDALANKKKVLSVTSRAYMLFSSGRTNVEVAIKLDLPQQQITQLRMEYWKMQDQDNLASLHIETKGKVGNLWKLYEELVIKRGMSYEKVASLVDNALNKLPYTETLLEQATWAADRQQKRFDSLENCIRALQEEEKRRKRMITLHPYSYYYLSDMQSPAANTIPYYSASSLPSSSLPKGSGVNYDECEKWIKKEKPREKDEIHEMYEGV
jgi:transposase-like protein